MADVILSLKGIVKHFPGVVANNHVDFELRKGEIHTLLGENGAGKTTLVNILYGLYTPDEGRITISGKQAIIHSPADALAYGIGMVHQHFMLIPIMSIAENVILGKEIKKRGLLDIKTTEEKIQLFSDKYKFDLNPHNLIEDLPIGKQQKVEILKALYREAHILILDEPTAVLTPNFPLNNFARIFTETRNPFLLDIQLHPSSESPPPGTTQ